MVERNELPSGEDLDPILLQLGGALMICQGLEGSLVFLLSVCAMEDSGVADGSFHAALDQLSQRSLGQLLKRLKERIDLESAAEGQLRTGWNSRNWIVHELLRTSAEEFKTSAGRLRVFKRIADEKKEIEKTDQLVNQILDSYLAKYGIAAVDATVGADRLWSQLHDSLE